MLAPEFYRDRFNFVPCPRRLTPTTAGAFHFV
jgi:hypothetical protein